MRPSRFYKESNFKQVYVERKARDYPLTQLVLRRFPKAHVVEIDRYQEVFNRSRQSWRDTKSVQKIILAEKTEPFLYPASDVIQGSQYGALFYTTPILNCLYDCDYCFLQGKFNSAHAVIFVNDDAFFKEVSRQLENGPFIVCPSYETDLMAFQSVVPWWQKWIEFARANPKLTVELRTKSGVTSPLSVVEPASNVILSWSISPEDVSKKYEKGTPELGSRIRAACHALKLGWNVRICFDPILAITGWQQIYGNFISEINSVLPLSKLFDIWVGTFRMNKEHLSRIKSQRDDSDILFYPFETSNAVACYPAALREEINDFFKKRLRDIIPQEKLILW
jgi:spore photoproduct lyase